MDKFWKINFCLAINLKFQLTLFSIVNFHKLEQSGFQITLNTWKTNYTTGFGTQTYFFWMEVITDSLRNSHNTQLLENISRNATSGMKSRKPNTAIMASIKWTYQWKTIYECQSELANIIPLFKMYPTQEWLT